MPPARIKVPCEQSPRQERGRSVHVERTANGGTSQGLRGSLGGRCRGRRASAPTCPKSHLHQTLLLQRPEHPPGSLSSLQASGVGGVQHPKSGLAASDPGGEGEGPPERCLRWAAGPPPSRGTRIPALPLPGPVLPPSPFLIWLNPCFQ